MAPSTRSGPTETKSGPLAPGLFKGLFIKIGSVGGAGEDGESSGSQPSPSSSRSPPDSSASSAASPSRTSAVKFAKSRNRAASQGLLPGKVPEDLKREISEAVTGLPRDHSRSHHSGPMDLQKESPRHFSGGSLTPLYPRAQSTSPGSTSSSPARASLPKDRSLAAPRKGGAGPSTDRRGAVRERRSASDGAAEHKAPSRLGNVSAFRKSSSYGSTLGNLEELQEDELQEAMGGPEGEGDLWEEIEPPAEFVCPLSMSVMHDPVIVSSGQTYERVFILRWLADGHATCPRTSQSLDPSATVPNQVLKLVIADWCKQNGVPPPTPRSPGLAFAALSRECSADAGAGADAEADAKGGANEDAGAGVPSSFVSSVGSEGSVRHLVQRNRRAAERASRATDRAKESERRQRALRDPGAYREASGKVAGAGRGQAVFLGAAGGGSGAVVRPQVFRRAKKISSVARSELDGNEAEAEEDGDGDGADSCWAGEEGEEGEEGKGGEGAFRASEESGAELRTPSPLGTGYGSFKGDPHGMSAWPGQLAMQGSFFRRMASKPRQFRSPSVAAAGVFEGGERREHGSQERQDSLGRSMSRSSTVDGGGSSSRRGSGRLGWDDPTSGGSERGGKLHSVDIEALVESLRSGAPEDQAAGAALLRVLTRNGFRNARRVVSSGAVGPLVGLLAAEDGPTVEHAVTTLLNLVLDERLKGKVGQEAELVPSLVGVLGAGVPAARANAAAALCCVSTLDGMRQRVCDAGAVPRLVDLLRDGGPPAKKDAANALVSLAMMKENRPPIAESGVVGVLCQLIFEGVDAVEEQTGAVFAGLVRDPGGRRVLEEEGAIEALAELLEGGATLRTREYAVSALLGLAVNSRACLADIDKEGLYTSIDVLTRNGSQKAQAKASALLELLRRFDTSDV